MGKNLCASSSQPNMVSPTSSFKPTLNDQDYMELVCENGKILAKSQKINNNGYFQNQRKQSILDLYETEYDESFKKNMKNLEETQVVPMSDEQTNNKKRTKSSKNELERDLLKGNKRFEAPTLNDYSLKGLKKVEVITAPPDEQSEAVGRSTKLYFTPSSMLSRGTSRDLSCSLKKRKCGDNEEEDEETTCLSNSSDDESDDAKTRFPTRTRKTMAKRKRSTEVHRLSERKRRHEISKKMRALQDLLPNYYKDDKVSLLDEAIKYTKTLQLQVQMMSMRNGLIQPSMMLPMCNYSPMGLGMHMGAAAAAATPTSLPEFMPMSVHGTCFRGNNMLNAFLNHPTGLVPNSPIFSPLESCSQQMVMPSCFPETQATSFSQFPKSDSTSNFENAMQFRGSSGY